jgi:hypothetical protein
MKKTAVILLCVVTLLIGFLVGGAAGYRYYPIHQQRQAVARAQATQAALEKCVLRGTLVSVQANAVVVKITGGADRGKTLTLIEAPGSTIQIENTILRAENQHIDLTRYFKAGDTVTVLSKDNITLTAKRIH